MKLVVSILSIFLLASCDCSCDVTQYGKHKYHRGDIAYRKIDDHKILILDTIRSPNCELAYQVSDGDDNTGRVDEIELK